MDQDYVYGICFLPEGDTVQIDAIYTSMHFERIFIPDEYEGTPKQAYEEIQAKIEHDKVALNNCKEKIVNSLRAHRLEILGAHYTISRASRLHGIRKLAACTKENKTNTVFYILCGFMTPANAMQLIKEIDPDPNVFLISQDPKRAQSKTPTKLHNPGIFRPFELFLRMYGVPAYNEIDPTIFIAITYSFMFGMMFGDVGQGACLLLGGYLLYRFKKIALAGAICFAGVFSVLFGFLYGSFFGFEDLEWLPTIWMNPMENIMTILIVSIAFGAFLILVAMIINIINGAKERDYERIFLDQSGLAGFLFYGTVILLIVTMFTGNPVPSAILLSILLGLPLLFIFLREPISRYLAKQKSLFHEGFGMFLLEGIVELFEVLLSYITNTISFVRVGAFALSHAGMMGVVLSLAHVAQGNPNWVILILGNILVSGLEGLVVGIQVLRLEYYEMFSRFYRGTGKEFKPF